MSLINSSDSAIDFIDKQGSTAVLHPQPLNWKQKVYYHLDVLGFDVTSPAEIVTTKAYEYDLCIADRDDGFNFICVCVEYCRDPDLLTNHLIQLSKASNQPLLVFKSTTDVISNLLYLNYLLNKA